MKAFSVWSTIFVLALSFVPAAHAQGDNGYVVPSIVYTDDDPDRVSDDGLNGFQVTFGRQIAEHFDVEGLLGYSSVSGYSDSSVSFPDTKIFDLGANLLFYPNRDWRATPYLLVGFGYLNSDLNPGASDASFSATLGAGVNWRLGDSPYSIRAEYRMRSADGTRATNGTDGNLTDNLFSLGLRYDFADAPVGIRGDGGWYIGGDIAFTDEDGDRVTSDAIGPQIRVGKRLTESLDVEALLGFASLDGYSDMTSSYPDQSILDFGVNVLVYPNRDMRVAPYLLAGLGYLNTEFKPGSGESGMSSTVGAGLKWKLGESAYSIRGEYRMRTVSGTRAIDGSDGTLTDNIISVGVQYDFGATKLYSEDDDSDGDGVLDIWDDCPDTPAGVDVSSRGCPLRDLRSDADGDRVPDDIDDCPNTPVGEVVDARGCPIDSDGDGVVTGRDRCPASRPGAQVDSFGCERDNDQDGVVDHLDSCLNTRPGVRVDTAGCEITEIIELPGVNFQTGSDRVVDGVDDILRGIAETLNKYPEMEIEVAGHTDSVGLGDANYGLSERRAVTVRDILIRFGVEEFRIRATGYGESQPIADNNTAEGRAKNRRVELRILNQ